MARRHADDLVFYAALGIILGGRIGYILFYNLSYYLQNPLDMLKLWLDSYGCDVTIATGGAEALRLIAGRPLDLIISDIGLPQIDGYELIRKLRMMAGLETVPAIALTGYARAEDRELALAAGYDAHLAKPAEIRSLLSLVKKLTKK